MNPKAQQTAIIVAAVLLVLWYLKEQAAETARRLNPVERDNFAYSGINAAGQALSEDEYWSFGSWLWEKVNPEARAAERELFGT